MHEETEYNNEKSLEEFREITADININTNRKRKYIR